MKMGSALKKFVPATLILLGVVVQYEAIGPRVSALVLIVYVFFSEERTRIKTAAVLLLLVAVASPSCIRDAAHVLLKKLGEMTEAQVSKEGVKVRFDGKKSDIDTLSPVNLKTSVHFEPLNALTNLINNGSFSIPLENKLSGWGTGLYVDQFKRLNPDKKITWINFLDADIGIGVVPTGAGHALRIENKSGSVSDKVGVMEQRITVTSGRYRLSFLASAESDLESGALEFVTTQGWDPRPERGGYELKEHGPFDWKPFSEIITIEQAGPVTFTLVSKGRGTIYITDLSLVRLPE